MNQKTIIIMIMVIISIAIIVAGWEYYPQKNNGWIVSLIFQFIISMGLVYSVRTYLKHAESESGPYY
jgi:hypothetical protein